MKIKQQLYDVGIRPTKERGQNFLFDSGAIQELIRFGDPKSDEAIIEIGPGLGALTKELVTFSPLTVIEIEERFCRNLKEQFSDLKIINQDVRSLDFSELGSNLVIFGNLPYSLSTDITFHLLSFAPSIKRAVLMLQREFVQRMVAKPGGKDYGALSVACQLQAVLRPGPVFSGNLFHPPTQVTSQVVELVFHDPTLEKITRDEKLTLDLLVKASFYRRRKKLVNSIKAASIFDPRILDQAIIESGIDSNRRAETLGVSEFINLARALISVKKG